MTNYISTDQQQLLVHELRSIPKKDLVAFAMSCDDDLLATADLLIREVGTTHAVATDILQARILHNLDQVESIVSTWEEARRTASRAMRWGLDGGASLINTIPSQRMLLYVQAHLLWGKHFRLARIAEQRLQSLPF